MVACGLGEEQGEWGKKGNLDFSEWCFNFDFRRMFYAIKKQILIMKTTEQKI